MILMRLAISLFALALLGLAVSFGAATGAQDLSSTAATEPAR
jgi:hypothetical protein